MNMIFDINACFFLTVIKFSPNHSDANYKLWHWLINGWESGGGGINFGDKIDLYTTIWYKKIPSSKPSKMYNHFVLGSNPTATGEGFCILFDILYYPFKI